MTASIFANRWARNVGILCFAIALTGCQAYTLVPAGQPVQVASALEVTPTIDWSRNKSGNREIWTVNGPVLESLFFYVGVEDGKTLEDTNARATKEGGAGKFRSDMDVLEISDLLKELYERANAEKFVYQNIAPQAFGNTEGFRFDFTLSTQDGLDKQGLAQGAVVDGKLYLAIYVGAKEFYFNAYQSAVEDILSSLHFVQEG